MSPSTSYSRGPSRRIMATLGIRKFYAVSRGTMGTIRLPPKSRKIQRSEDPLCLPQETERTLAGRSLRRAKRHSNAEGTKVILKGLTALQYSGQVGKLSKNCTGQDTSAPDERAQALRENHKSGRLLRQPSHHLSQKSRRTHPTHTYNRL